MTICDPIQLPIQLVVPHTPTSSKNSPQPKRHYAHKSRANRVAFSPQPRWCENPPQSQTTCLNRLKKFTVPTIRGPVAILVMGMDAIVIGGLNAIAETRLTFDVEQ